MIPRPSSATADPVLVAALSPPRAAARALRGHLRLRREWYLVPLFFAAVVALLHWEIWWVADRGVGWDLIESYWPDLAFFARELGRGNFPLWNPTERGGVPANADPQMALFYPVQWLLAGWAVLRGEASWSLIQFKELFHHALAGTLMYLFARTRRLPWQAALVAGLAVVLAESWVQLKSNAFLYPLAWTPLVFIATDAFFARPGARRAAALAAALYLPGSVGSPPGYFYMLLLALPYGVFRATEFVALALGDGRSGWRRVGRAVAFLGVSAVLVGATQALLLLPVQDLVALSPRAARTVDFAVLGHSGPHKTWPALMAPLRDTYTTHCGLLTPVLAAAALALRPQRDRFAPVFFAVMTGFFLVLSFGPTTPVLRYLVIHLPGFGLFRASARYLVALPIAYGMVAAYGLATLLDARSRRRGSLAVVVLVGLGVIVFTKWLRDFDAELIFSQKWPQRPIVLAVLLALFIVALVLLPRRSVPAVAALGVFAFYGLGLHTVRRELGYQPRPDHREDLARVSELADLESYRVYDEFLLEQRAGSRLGLREFRGYPSEDPLTRNDYIQILAAATRPGGMPLLGEYNIRYVFFGPHTTKGWGRKRLPTYPDEAAPRTFKKLGPAIFEHQHPAPLFAWYGGVRAVPGADVLPALQAARDERGVRRVAIVDKDAVPPALAARLAPFLTEGPGKPPAVPGRVTRFETEHVSGEVDAPGPGVVVLNEFLFKGWRVFVDGREEIPFAIDYCLRGVIIDAGKHHVTWTYTPPRWHGLFGAWLIGMAAFAWAAALAFRDRRRAARAPLHHLHLVGSA